MLSLIILILVTVLTVVTILFAGKRALFIRGNQKYDKGIYIKNCGIHTDERKVHRFIASGYLDATK